MRVLKVDLEQLLIGDAQHLSVLGAFDCRGPPVIRRKEAEFTHQASRWNRDVDLGDEETSGDGQQHFLRGVVLFEKRVALAIFARGHERLEPFHRHVTRRRGTRLLDEVEHLMKAKGVDGQQQQIQQEGLDVRGEGAEGRETHAADHIRDA